MQRTSFTEIDCPIAQTLEAVGDWWSLLIVRDAMLGVQRFDAFQNRLGIARNILSQRLKKLVAEGILRTRQYQERPKRVEYVLTAKGRSLFPIIAAMVEWGRQHGHDGKGENLCLAFPEIGEPVELKLNDAGTGREVSLNTVVMLDQRTGKPIRPAARPAAGAANSSK